MKILRIIVPIIVLGTSIYGLISKSDALLPYMMFFLGMMSLINGISDLQKQRKTTGTLSILVSVFVLFVFIQGLLR